MDVVRKAADALKNSPLFRRRFGYGNQEQEHTRVYHPEKDLTPFVQGIYYKVRRTST